MKLFNSEGREVCKVVASKKPKFSTHQSRKWVFVEKVIDGQSVQWWYDERFGKKFYFEYQGRWHGTPLVNESYWNSLREGEELSTKGVRIERSAHTAPFPFFSLQGRN